MRTIYIFLLILLFSCKKNSEKTNGLELFKKSDLVFDKTQEIIEGEELVSAIEIGYFQEYLFIKSTNYPFKIIKTTANRLYAIYQNYYKDEFGNYSEFLYNALNFKIVIPLNLINKDEIIDLDINVIDEYNKNGIKYILVNYTYNEDEKVFLHENLSDKEKITIIYILYINAYQYNFDDHNVREWFIKQNSLKYILR